jgi:hypothetical protein
VSWTVPPTWEATDWWLYNGGEPEGIFISATLVAGVYRDACQWHTWLIELLEAPTVDETIAVIAAQPSRDATEPVDITLDGHAGKRPAISVPEDAVFADCTEGQFRTYVTPDDGVRHHQGPGQIYELWVVDVDGTTDRLGRSFFPGASQAALAESASIIDSVRFVIPTPSPSAEVAP